MLAFSICCSGEAENQAAFTAHFTAELSQYRKVTVLNLVDQSGKEKVIADAFLTHVVALNSPDVTYVAFDFHEYWQVDSTVIFSILQ